MIGRAKRRGGGGEKRSGRIADGLDGPFFFFFTCCDCVDRGFSRGRTVAQQKESKREEEGRLTKIPSPMEKYNVAIKRRDETETETRRKETPISGSAGPSPVRIIWPTAKARTVTLLGRRPRHGW